MIAKSTAPTRAARNLPSVRKRAVQRCPCGRACAQCSRHDVASHVAAGLRSSWHPLDISTRSFMESRFGLAFGDIRLHTDSRAAESARGLNAFAYTVGDDIVFGAGRHAPATASGDRLLAHELTHVVQGNRTKVGSSFNSLQMTSKDDPLEREAEAVAQQVVGAESLGQYSTGTVIASRSMIMRQQQVDTSDPQVAPQALMDQANALRLNFLSTAGYRAHQLAIACAEQADPTTLTQALPGEVRAFVSWIGVTPWDDAFCTAVALVESDIAKNAALDVPAFLFADESDPICAYKDHFAYAIYEDSVIRVCPKTVDPQLSNPTLRALVLIHEMFHAASFAMSHESGLEESTHCGFAGSDEALSNPYCVTNLIGQLGGGDYAKM